MCEYKNYSIFIIVYLLECSTFSLLLRLSDKFKHTSLTGRSSKFVKHTETLYHSNNSAGFLCLISMPSLELLGLRVVDVICLIRSNLSSDALDRLKPGRKRLKYFK